MEKLDTFTLAYIECALWSSTDEFDPETGGEPMDKNYDIEDISPETLKVMIGDCLDFQNKYYDKIADDVGKAGHDFWLTRNGHGAGFWDGDWPEYGDFLTDKSYEYGEFNLYVGDDGLIYH